jgi:hypothetical protein
MNDFQNAFELSKSEYQNKSQLKEAEALAEQGKFPVCSEDSIHCPFTDAVLGNELHIWETFDTLPEAEAFVKKKEPDEDAEPYLFVFRKIEPVGMAQDQGPDCPF